MNSLADQLRAIADQLDQTVHASPAAEAIPPGYVAVHPTGPHGEGKMRLYPEPKPEEGWPAYLGRCNSTLGWGSEALGMALFGGSSYIFADTKGDANNPADWPAGADRFRYPDDWASQALLDSLARQRAADKASGVSFSPG